MPLIVGCAVRSVDVEVCCVVVVEKTNREEAGGEGRGASARDSIFAGCAGCGRSDAVQTRSANKKKCADHEEITADNK